jgi:ppGpp synthetase/RelA/SpoT-type nucleotidyltranferase
MTKSQVNKLGDQIRAAGGTLSLEMLQRLQAFRATRDAPMRKAQALLREGIGVESTARLKTVNTLVEKLCREKTRLAEMQDIAGLRIVRAMTLAEQDALTQSVAELFPGAKVHDRRATPSHGYRAVHVIATVEGCPVEIQIRTEMQDGWAQAMERMADEVGRGIRYGEKPQSREVDVELLMGISPMVAEVEELRQTVTGADSKARLAKIEEQLWGILSPKGAGQ